MPSLMLVSAQPLAGKSTIGAGLAEVLRAAGKSAEITESPAGETQAPAGAKALVIAMGTGEAADVAQFSKPFGAALAGIIVNRVPVTRLEAVRSAYAAAGLTPLAFVPEDRLLAAPVLSQVAGALGAEVSFLDGNAGRSLDRTLIASISADPGQGYFTRYGATAVIVRSDKPDLQLAALNAGAICLIVTGGLPILSYVLERAEADEIPVLRTGHDTLETVSAIEGLFGVAPFAGGEPKLRRIAELLSDVDLAALLG